MIELHGKSVCEGIAIGKIKIISHRDRQIEKRAVSDAAAEVQRFQTARVAVVAELGQLYEKMFTTLGEENAAIFQVHQMMADDLDFIDTVEAKIADDNVCAEYAVEQAGYELSQIFSQMDDAYMKARAVDIIDVSGRVVDKLIGYCDRAELTEPVILASSDFTPGELVKFDKSKILGLVTAFGSDNSHTAIIARTLCIPGIVAMGDSVNVEYDGSIAVVDGDSGKVIILPDEDILADYRQKAKAIEREKARLHMLVGQPTVTKKGAAIKLYANIGSVDDVDAVLRNDGEGVGLFRSEFLYLGQNDYPSEEFQYKEYVKALVKLNKPMIIHTMDIGADKKVDYFNLPKEENPALGYRSIRICFDRPEILLTQMRALYRASAHGNLSVMIPMITSVEEVDFCLNIARKAREQLRDENLPFCENMPIGIMIETPAAALISDELAKKVDFFSIGTNDLGQYTLAIDRQNQSLEKLYNPQHKALLKLIEMTVANAHKAGIWVGVCGELARNLELTEFFVKIGVDELSVSPPYILSLREKICSL